MAGTVGARGVVNQHPLISTIENAGKAFKDMGNLFNQTRQTRAYEKSIQNQHWQNMVTSTLQLYDRMSEYADPMALEDTFRPMFEELLANGGMGRATVKQLSKRVTDYNLNYAALLDRISVDALLDESKGGGLDPGKTSQIVDEEVRRTKEEEALKELTTPQEAQAPAAPVEETPSAGPVERPRPQQGPWAAAPSAVSGPFEPPPAELPVEERNQVFPPPQSTPVTRPGQRIALTQENVASALQQFRLMKPEQKTTWLRENFPEIRTITPKIRVAFETLAIGIRNDDPKMQYKAVKLWAEQMYKEATP